MKLIVIIAFLPLLLNLTFGMDKSISKVLKKMARQIENHVDLKYFENEETLSRVWDIEDINWKCQKMSRKVMTNNFEELLMSYFVLSSHVDLLKYHIKLKDLALIEFNKLIGKKKLFYCQGNKKINDTSRLEFKYFFTHNYALLLEFNWLNGF